MSANPPESKPEPNEAEDRSGSETKTSAQQTETSEGHGDRASPELTSDDGAPTSDDGASESGDEREPPAAARPPPKGERSSKLWLVGSLLLLLLGGALTFTVMSAERPLPGGVVWGGFGCLLSTLGLLWLVTPRASLATQSVLVDARDVLRPALMMSGALAVHFGSGVLAVAGVLPLHRVTAALLLTSTFLWLLVSAYGLCQAIGFFRPAEASDSSRSPVWRRHGFWLLAVASVLYLPMLGNFPLLDPWETHYGEVAREMLARDDWVSLWWAQDGWFFTKPILNFWIQGLSFKLFGIEYMPDQMIASALHGRVPQPEWAARLPIFWMTLAANYALYKASALLLGRRVALLGGFILLTCPYWLLLARQTMADMPYVAPMCVALALQLIAFRTHPLDQAREYEIRFGSRRLRFDAFHLLFGATLLIVLPQVIHLFSLNFTFHLGDPFGFRPHVDEIPRGSGGGNCGLPGNRSCRTLEPKYDWGQPSAFGLLWLLIVVGLLLWNRKERRVQRLLFLGSWVATALSVMAKGAPGFVLPLVTAIGYPVVTGRFRDLLRMKLPSLLLLTACVALPWYVQMYMRHGMPFFDRLVLHDMVNRAFSHVHDTNTGDDTSFRYYVWQLGYGLFPWTGLAAGGLIWWARGGERENSPRNQAIIFMLLWFLAAFGMFTLTLTKFHHYILPLVPPTAILSGILLAAYLPRGLFARPGRAALYFGLMLLVAEAWCFSVACFYPDWKSFLFANNGEAEAAPLIGLSAAAIGLALLIAAVRLAPPASPSRLADQPSRDRALGVVAVLAAIAVALAGRDMVVTRDGDVEGQIRLLHLITYNYDRPWPEVLDLRGSFAGFTAVAGVACLGLAVTRLRRHAAVLFGAVAFLWAAWCADEYLLRIAPHWSQRDNMLAYYKHREDDDHLLVAYQMNWKGENFYTGNRMATFVQSGAKFKRWLKKQRKKGVRTMFFTTEHTRIKSLKREIGAVDEFVELTTEAQDNKFFVAKVVFPKWSAKDEEEDKKPDDAKKGNKKGKK